MLPDLSAMTDAELHEHWKCIRQRRDDAVSRLQHHQAMVKDQERELERIYREKQRRG